MIEYGQWYLNKGIFEIVLIIVFNINRDRDIAWEWDGEGTYIGFSPRCSKIEEWDPNGMTPIEQPKLTKHQKRKMIKDLYGI